mgnify:CR=1 FL=1
MCTSLFEIGRSSDLLLALNPSRAIHFDISRTSMVSQWAGVVVLFNVLKLTAAGTVQEFFSFKEKALDSHFNSLPIVIGAETKTRGKGRLFLDVRGWMLEIRFFTNDDKKLGIIYLPVMILL